MAMLLALALILGDAPANDPSAPEAALARGTLLFADAFSAGPGTGWTFDRDSVWTLSGGRLHAELPDGKQRRSFAYFGSDKWRDYVLDVDVCGIRGVDKGVAVRVDGDRGVGIDLRGPGYNDVLMYRGYQHWAHAAAPNRNNKWYHLRVEVRRNRYRVFVNGNLAIDYTDDTNSRPHGRVALAAYTGGTGECEALFDNVEVREVK